MKFGLARTKKFKKSFKKLHLKDNMVIGTNAIYAYEAAAGVFFDISTMATKDMDILWDIRPKLIFVADKDMDNTGFLGIIRKADRSFESISPGGFRAVNRDGFMVEKQRDHDQGLAVAQLIIQYLPQYQFNTSELRMFSRPHPSPHPRGKL